MGRGVCMCVTGPPAGGVCAACGAVGAPLPYPAGPPAPAPQPVGRVEVHHYPASEDAIRRIVREEIARALAPPRKDETDGR